jgi:fatty-acyl-CoA synthase
VAILAYNCLEMVEAYFACARLGAISVPLNFRLVAGEVGHQLDDSGAALVIVDAALLPLVAYGSRLVIGGDGADSYEAALESASPHHELVPAGTERVTYRFFVPRSGRRSSTCPTSAHATCPRCG